MTRSLSVRSKVDDQLPVEPAMDSAVTLLVPAVPAPLRTFTVPASIASEATRMLLTARLPAPVFVSFTVDGWRFATVSVEPAGETLNDASFERVSGALIVWLP